MSSLLSTIGSGFSWMVSVVSTQYARCQLSSQYTDFERAWGTQALAALPKICVKEFEGFYKLERLVTYVTTQNGWEGIIIKVYRNAIVIINRYSRRDIIDDPTWKARSKSDLIPFSQNYDNLTKLDFESLINARCVRHVTHLTMIHRIKMMESKSIAALPDNFCQLNHMYEELCPDKAMAEDTEQYNKETQIVKEYFIELDELKKKYKDARASVKSYLNWYGAILTKRSVRILSPSERKREGSCHCQNLKMTIEEGGRVTPRTPTELSSYLLLDKLDNDTRI